MPSELPDTPLTEYWLVFKNSNQWIARFLRPHFSHVCVLTRDQFNWIVINPERLYLRVEIAPYKASHDLIDLWCEDEETVLKVTFMPRDTTLRFGWYGAFSCVTLVRYLLGLRINCLTPYGLYKKLISLSVNREWMRKHRIESIELIKQGCLDYVRDRPRNWWALWWGR